MRLLVLPVIPIFNILPPAQRLRERWTMRVVKMDQPWKAFLRAMKEDCLLVVSIMQQRGRALNTPACACSSSSFRRLLFPSNSFTNALSPAQSAAAGVAELRALTVVDFAEKVIKLWLVKEGICTSAGWDWSCRTVLHTFVGPAGQPVEPKRNPPPGCSCRLFVWLCSP